MNDSDAVANKIVAGIGLIVVSLIGMFIAVGIITTSGLTGSKRPGIILGAISILLFIGGLVFLGQIFFSSHSKTKGKVLQAKNLEVQVVDAKIIARYAYDKMEVMSFPTEPDEVFDAKFYIQAEFQDGTHEEFQVSESQFFAVGEGLNGRLTCRGNKFIGFNIFRADAPLETNEWNNK